MTNRDRRKIIAGIFADTAKYGLIAGIIGAIISGEISSPITLILGLTATLFSVLAYYVTPKDSNDLKN